jgi:hypothetical protein
MSFPMQRADLGLPGVVLLLVSIPPALESLLEVYCSMRCVDASVE